MRFDLSKVDWKPGLRAGYNAAQFWERVSGMPEGSFVGLVNGIAVFEVDDLPEESDIEQ